MQSDRALQVRMRHLLKKQFMALDIARPLLAFESIENIPYTISDGENLHEYCSLTHQGSPQVYIQLSSTERPTQTFDVSPIINQHTSLRDALLLLADHEVIFISTLDQINAYITVNDIQKAPVRMWLFGIITVIEMFITRLIKEAYPEDSWASIISPGRHQKAVELLAERQRRGQTPSLTDCLQLSDKVELIAKSDELRETYDFGSKTTIRKRLKGLESLRNSLAHSQHIENWQDVVLFANSLDKVLKRI